MSSATAPRQAPEHRSAGDALGGRFKAIVEAHSEMVSLALASGELLYVSPAYAARFGLRPEAFVGTNLLDRVDPEDLEPVRTRMREVMDTGAVLRSDNRMRAADGSVRWVHWTNSRHLAPGQPPVFVSVGRDVTDRVAAESALRASEAFLERSGRLAGVGGWELDLRTQQITWSRQTRRLHEVPDDFAPTLETAIAFYAPEARRTIEEAVRVGVARGDPWDLELPLITARGRRLWVRALGEVEHEQGRPVRLIGAVQDITERRRLEERTARSERFLRQLTDSLPVRIAYVDAQRRYRFVNQALLQHLHRSRDEVIGRTRAELLPDADDSVLAEHARAALAGEPQRFEFEEAASGRVRRIENQLIPDRDDAGDVRGFFVTGVDVTDRSVAEKAARDLAAILDNSSDFVVQTDWRGQVLYVNPAARQALGIDADASVGMHNFAEFNTPATNELFAKEIVPAVKRTGVWLGETTIYLRGRREVPVSHLVVAHRGADGRVERYSAVIRDLSAQVEAQRELLRQTETLRSVADAIPASVAVADRRGVYRFVNRSFAQRTGQPPAELIGRTATEVLGTAEFERRRPWITRAMDGERVTFEVTDAAGAATEHRSVTYIPLHAASGEVDGFVAVEQDITSHRRETSRLQELARHDPLTGLLNRAGFEQALAALRPSADCRGVALLYIDLDRFKPVNDRHGHPVGDRVLQIFAKRLGNAVRSSDATCRLGGDEFAAALVGVRGPEDARAVARKVLAAARSPIHVGELVLQIGASVGVAFSADLAGGWSDLIARADAALLRAKAGGRDRSVMGEG